MFLLNQQLFLFLFTWGNKTPLLQDGVKFIAQHGDKVILIGIVIGVFAYSWHHRHDAHKMIVYAFAEIVALGITGGSAWLIALLIKAVVHAPRPFITIPIQPLFTYGGYDSFPSGHATVFFALATAVFLMGTRLTRITGSILFMCAILVSLARVSAGIHYPMDIFAGLVLGITVAVLIHRSTRRYIVPLVSRYLFP